MKRGNSLKKRGILNQLFYEDNTLSLTRLMALFSYLVFVAGSFYLLYNNIDWGGYAVFATYTGAVGAAIQTTNKFINSKYNSPSGSYGIENEGIPKEIINKEKIEPTKVNKEVDDKLNLGNK